MEDPPQVLPPVTDNERAVLSVLRSLRHGEVVVKVQDGAVVYITKSEGLRPCDVYDKDK